ncbi:MAG TPA: acyltransferase family protein [Caulobacteraceae bacterium]|nr:acyltransferase family protein [Caulobacteraceae bacterium]
MTVQATSTARRADLDWIRVAAFGLLILYHVGLVYGPWDWHIQSQHRFGWMREAVLVTNPWRLTLLFLVSGAALRFMTLRRTVGEVARARLERLVPPLVFGTVVLVPIQSWIEALDKGYWDGGFFHWLVREFGLSGLADGVPVNHLWFVVYIAAYSLAAIALIARRGGVAALEAQLASRLTGWRMLVYPAAYLIAIRILLYPFFGLSNQLAVDWYNHALSFGAFLFGFLLVRREGLWRELERHRWTSLAVAAAALPLMMAQTAHPGGGAFLGIPRAVVYGIDQWATIAAILGFAGKHLRTADTPRLRYLTEAVFPCYLAHQTVLVAAVWVLKPAGLPAAVEALCLVAITFAGSFLIYEMVRRVPILRPLWGLKPDETPKFARRRLLLRVGILAPVFAIACVALAVATYPGFDHARQYLSELGGASARRPVIFNTGVFIAGLMAALAGIGFGLAVYGLTRARVVSVLTAAVFVAAGAGLSLSTLYPWPDPRHMVINLGLGIQLAPVLLIWGLSQRRDLGGLKWFLGVVAVLMAALTVTTKHLVFPGMVHDANVGWWERAYVLVLVGWVAVAAYVLERRLRIEASAA